jgi:hypothetical protein
VFKATESDDLVYVTPPVNGWTLAVGDALLCIVHGEVGRDLAVRLSHRFSEVQLFGSMRVSDAYMWVKAEHGKVLRHYCHGDGTLYYDDGERTEIEQKVCNFTDPNTDETHTAEFWKRKDLNILNEEHVLKVAEAWSINPAKLGEMGLNQELGLIGHFERPDSHRSSLPAVKKSYFQRLISRLTGH